MEENSQVNSSSANSYLISSGLALHFFWILNVFKEAYPGVKGFLTFYDPVGPLLGLFILAAAMFFGFVIVFKIIKISSQAFAYWFFVITTIIFVLMVFPPVFEPIAHALGG